MAEERQSSEIFARNLEVGGNVEVSWAKSVKQSEPITFPLVELPFLKNIQFTGREKQLSQISDCLSQYYQLY